MTTEAGAAHAGIPAGNGGEYGAAQAPADDGYSGDALPGGSGVPKTAEGYELDVSEDHDPGMIAQIREIFHGAGLSTTQAAQVYGAYMRMLEPHLAARREAAEAGAREAAAAVRELGAARMTGAKAAFKRYVGDDEALALRLEDSLGDGEMIRMFDRIALDMAEDDKGALGLRGGAENRDREYSMRDIIADAFARHK